MPARPLPFEAFVAPARARPALWRLALGAILAAAAWLGSIALLLPLAARADPGRLLLLAYLASFAGLALGTAAAARLLQRRSPSPSSAPAASACAPSPPASPSSLSSPSSPPR